LFFLYESINKHQFIGTFNKLFGWLM
jgi:hypothetical protein